LWKYLPSAPKNNKITYVNASCNCNVTKTTKQHNYIKKCLVAYFVDFFCHVPTVFEHTDDTNGVADPDPHHFGKPDLDPHQSKKPKSKFRNWKGKKGSHRGQCCGSGMFILDPNLFHPGSRAKRFPDPHPQKRIFKYFNPKNGF
jgi:hypothetical protein